MHILHHTAFKRVVLEMGLRGETQMRTDKEYAFCVYVCVYIIYMDMAVGVHCKASDTLGFQLD